MLNINQNTISFRNLYAFGEKLPIDLSLSENPLGCSPRVKDFIRKNRFDVSEYPDPLLKKLKLAIAKNCGVSVANIFIGNGSESIIKLLPELLSRSGSVIIPKVTFPLFEIVAGLKGLRIILSEMTTQLDINLNDIRNKITKDTELIVLCNPNNPTGKLISKKEIINFVRSVKPLVVVDEANIEFGGESVVFETNNLDNLVVLKTLSKGFGLAGIRVGFCIANSNVIRSLERISQPFPVTNISEETACVALSDKEFINRTRRLMETERTFLTGELRERGFNVIESQANNLLVDVSRFAQTSTQFVEKLNSKDVSVVDGASFKNLSNKFIRISPRLRDTNIKFLSIVDSLINYDLNKKYEK